MGSVAQADRMGWHPWSGYDVPDIPPTSAPDKVGPFIMNPEGVPGLFTRG